MAEAAVFMFVEPVVKILLNEVIEQGSKFKDKARSALRFNADIVQLSNDLKDLSVVLEDAMPDYQRFEVSPYAQDPQYRKFVKDLYKVAQDAEDVIQDCQYVKKGFRRLILPILVSRRLEGIQQRITSLKRISFPRIESPEEYRAAPQSRAGTSSSGMMVLYSPIPPQLQMTPDQFRGATLRLASMRRDSIKRRLQPVEGIPLGLNEQISCVQKMLIEDEETYILGIHGMGGSGKSVLMKCVWNSDEVQKSFEYDLLVWISIYPNQIAASQCDLAGQLSMEFNTAWSQRDGKNIIHNHLVRKRFLMVVEDLWPNGSGRFLWDVGVPYEKANGSKIVVISRYKEDLTKIRPDMPLIYLSPLSKEDSWRLFECYAFGSTGSPLRPEVRQNAEKIVTRCNGHPLALKAYGAAMAAKRDPSDWQLPSEGTTDQDKNFFVNRSAAEREILECLRSSYESLSLPLRLAFLYFAAFPKGLVVRTADIIDLWTAEMLIPAYSPSQADRNGRKMLKILLERCVVEGVEAGSLGVVRKCKMHPMFRLLAHDILRRQNEEDEDGEGTSLFRAGDNLTEFPSQEIRQQRRISLMYNHITSLPREFRCPGLRTLILRHSKSLTVIPPSFLKRLKWLRTLDLSMTSIESLPDTLSLLKRLENLNLSRTKLKTLPVAITGLHRLKKLNLFECTQLERLPLDMNKLEYLRYLNLRRCTALEFLPYQVTQIYSLQCLVMDGCQKLEWKTLHQNSALPNTIQYSRLEDLQSLVHLKYLSFVCASATRIPDGLMGHFENLERLEICAVQLGSLPEEIQYMKKLMDLRLSRLEALIQFPQWLCSVESLRRITLEYLKDLPAEFCKESAFPALEELRLDHLTALTELPPFAQGTMRMFKELRVRYCKKINRFPMGVEKLKKNIKIDMAGSVGLIDSVGDNGIDRERMINFRANLSY